MVGHDVKTTTTGDAVPVSPHNHPPPTKHWTTGFWRRFPWAGIAALLAVVVAAAIMVLVLVLSNDQAIDKWSVQPTVYLAIASTAANIALRFALSQGVVIAWWVKAMKPDSTVRDLHNVWAFGSSVWDAFLAGRSFNLIALASLALALAPINGPLLQRASSVVLQTEVQAKTITIPMAQALPYGFTGIITGRSHQVALPTFNFSSIANDFKAHRPMIVAGSGCIGTCTGHILGAGYTVTCINNTIPFDLSLENSQTGDSALVFSTNFTYSEGEEGRINFTAIWKQQTSCKGLLSHTKCTLLPATIEYPILLNNDTVSLDPSGSFVTDRVKGMRPVRGNSFIGPSTHGGMQLVLDALYHSQSSIRTSGAIGYITTSSGPAAFEFVGTDVTTSDCNVTWKDPTTDILSSVRELAFRSALFAAANNVTYQDDNPDLTSKVGDPSEYIQQIQVQQSNIQAVFVTHYRFLAVSLFFTLLAAFSVVPVFLGWWSLGRKVSLSPIETAKAFAAPALAGVSDANAEAKPLLREAGDLRLRYGAVPAGEGIRAGGEANFPGANQFTSTLKFEVPEGCSRPQDGSVYIG